jgi:protein-disulfide isomerase
MKNNALVIILSLIIVILAGSCLLFFIGSTVSVSLDPLKMKVSESVGLERALVKRLDSRTGVEILRELKSINQRLTTIEGKLNKINTVNPSRPTPGGGGCGGGAPEDYTKVYDIKVGDSPVLGKKDAPITITAFFDLQCPFCARFYPPVKDVVNAYPDKVKLVVKNFPLSFHPNALGAAKLALTAQSYGKYYEMMELLLQNGGSTTDDKVKEYAQKLGLDYNKLMDDFKNKDAQWQKRIDEDKVLAAQVGVGGTPTFYINGRRTQARDLASYKAEIDKILAAKK